jgi:hypothetical protein
VKTQHLMGMPIAAKRCVVSIADFHGNAWHLKDQTLVAVLHVFGGKRKFKRSICLVFFTVIFLFSELTNAFRFRFRISVSDLCWMNGSDTIVDWPDAF